MIKVCFENTVENMIPTFLLSSLTTNNIQVPSPTHVPKMSTRHSEHSQQNKSISIVARVMHALWLKHDKKNYIPLLNFSKLCQYRIDVFECSVGLLSHLQTMEYEMKEKDKKITVLLSMCKKWQLTFAPVKTILPETKIKRTIFGCFIR